jgi:hypothetical protein
LLPIGPPDLTQMMMIEYTGSYGNDWFVVPLELPVGSINRVNSLVITDSFGVHEDTGRVATILGYPTDKLTQAG